ncbi:MAG: TonB-dependent receptor [Chlorobi bacterium]|nr:TonB-dependent receptor [Chlorobiota bacterium]
MNRIAFFLFVFLYSGAFINAQYKISGTVTDENNKPMPGVNVAIEGTFEGTITNSSGKYELNLKKKGSYQIDFSFVGYEKQSIPVTLSKDELSVNVKMKPSVIIANEVVVSAIRANKEIPVTYSEIDAGEIKELNYAKDMPYLFDQTPSVVTTSDAGAGVGYTSFRIRGTDMTRINVTINGIPLNDAESQGVYFVDMPDLAASVDKIQIQRGVGTSTNGIASFGASVNFSTLNDNPTPGATVDNSYGSFDTWKNSVSVSTGLLGNFAFNARLSRVTSDGYIDRATSDLKSYYLSGAYYGNNFSLKLITFSGLEKTYQAWYGVPKVKLENDIEGMKKLVIMDGWSDEEAENLFNSNPRTFNRYLYENQTDNYKQTHYQLHYSHELNSKLNISAALHYTKGEGYYESYKYNRKFSKYGFAFNEITIDGESITKTDLIEQKWLDNDFYGIVFSSNYNAGRLQLTLGGGYNYYDGDHFGKVIWMKYNNGIAPDYEWYRNNGTKSDFNIYMKGIFDVSNNVNLFGDIQYRNVNIDMKGIHDDLSDITQSHLFNFVNPKAGINWNLSDKNRIFASFAMAQREPTRSDFRDAPDNRKPKQEILYDYEFGYSFKTNKVSLDANLFYMDYKDQLVLTGEINNVGDAIMVNVPSSYRKGIEVSGNIILSQNINWGLNLSLSSNKIDNFTEYVDNWSYWDDPDNEPLQIVTNLGKTDIAFSPEVIAGSRIAWKPVSGITLTLMSKYVGKQYIDNTSSEERKLDPWFVNDFMANYDFKIKNIGSFGLSFLVNNIFDEKYESNAWVYQYYYNGEHDVLDGYFPQAGTNVMVRLVMNF